MKKYKKRKIHQDNTSTYSAWFINVCDKIIFICLVLILIGVPLIIDPRISSIELGKVIWMWVLSCVCILAWIIKIIITKRIEILSTPLNPALLALLLTCILSTVFSMLPYISLVGEYKRHEGLITLINYVILYYLCMDIIVRYPEYITKIYYTLMYVAMAAAICGILQPFGIDLSRWGSSGIPISTFGNTNYAGGYMAMVIFIGIGLLLSCRDKKGIFITGLSISLMYACLIITKNRGGFLGLICGLFLFVILNYTELYKLRTRIFITGLVLIMITIMLCMHEKTSPVAKLAGTFKIVETTEGKKTIEAAGTFANRIYIWQICLRVIADNPVFGVGPDVLRMATTQHENIEFIRAEGGYNVLIDKAHNEILDITATRGICGVIAYLWVICMFFIIVWKMCKIIEYPQKWFITAGASAVISYIIQNQVGFGVIPTSSLFWILVGIVIGAGANNMKYRYHTQRINILSRILLLVIGTIVSILLIRYSINACIADVYYKNALALTHDGELSQAIYMYEKALEYNPGEEFYYGEMLSVYSDMSDTSREALDMLIRRAKDAVKCNPYHAYYYNILSSAYGKAYVKYGDISARNKAIEACKKALKLKPLFGDPHNNLAAIYVHEHKYKEAMDEIKKALEIYSENAEYWRILGELQLNQGLTEQGIAALEQAVKYNPELVNTLIILGKYYFNRGKLSEAAKKFEQIVRLVPDNFQYHSDLGSIYFKLHRFDAAANEFAIALKLYPEHKYSLDMLALCKERMKTR